MKKWLSTLLSETGFSIWWILSVLSTLSTFFFHSWSGQLRLLFGFSALIGFAWANFKVFSRQEARIAELERASLQQATPPQDTRNTRLTITPNNGSRYILQPVQNVPRGDFSSAYLEFHLMIENSGRRNAIMNRFEIEITELGRTFQNLTPDEGRRAIQGRHCSQGLNIDDTLSRTGVIRINAENATNRGTLRFFIPNITLEMFVNSGLQMTAGERRFPALHCRLTLIDTTDTSATALFELHEE